MKRAYTTTHTCEAGRDGLLEINNQPNVGPVYGCQINTQAAVLTGILHDPGHLHPFGLAPSPQGELFAGTASNDQNLRRPGFVRRYGEPCTVNEFSGQSGAGALLQPHSRSFRGNELLVTHHGTNRVRRCTFPANGAEVEQPSMTSALVNCAARAVVAKSDVSEIVISPWGELPVNNALEASVIRFTFDAIRRPVDHGAIPLPTIGGQMHFTSTGGQATFNPVALDIFPAPAQNSYHLRWTVNPGLLCHIEYSSDLQFWHSVPGAIQAASALENWTGPGPPAAEVFPSPVPNRFFRIFEMQQQFRPMKAIPVTALLFIPHLLAVPAFAAPLQQAYAKPSNPGYGDNFGQSVAVSGNTAVVGAPLEWGGSAGVNQPANDNQQEAGAAYVFVRSGTVWSQQAYVKSSHPGLRDLFGFSVAIDGDTMVVGAPGESGSGTGVNPVHNDNAEKAGAAYVFVRTGTTWTQQATLKAHNIGAGDNFGYSVGVSGNTVVVGAFYEDGGSQGVNQPSNENAADAGAAYVFVRNGTTWTQQAYLKASNAGADDWMGVAVAVSGDTVVAGAMQEDGSGTGSNPPDDDCARNAGAAYVFVRNGTAWSQQAYVKAGNAGGFDRFGSSVAASGNSIIIGASEEYGAGQGVNPPDDNSAYAAGAAYIFNRSGTTWTQQAYLKASNSEERDFFGNAVALSGDIAVVGAWQEDGGGTGISPAVSETQEYSGAAYVFGRCGSTWSQLGYVKASNTEFLDYFGTGVAVSGDTVVVGATGEDGGNAGINPVVTDTHTGAGAAYFFNGFVVACSTVQATITGTSRSAGGFTIDFKSTAGLTGWRIKGGATTAAFPDDRTAQSTITETSPGVYRAVVSLTGAPAQKYFLRIER